MLVRIALRHKEKRKAVLDERVSSQVFPGREAQSKRMLATKVVKV
jgi:hypothetical protein